VGDNKAGPGPALEELLEPLDHRQSRWLVGSSRSNRSGAVSSAFASATRVFWPPLNWLTGWPNWSGEKPRPSRTSSVRCSMS
jgi:hypothetical protein